MDNIPATFDAGRAWSFNAEINYAPAANLYEALLDPFHPNRAIESLRHLERMNILCVDGHVVPFRPEPDGTSEEFPWPSAWSMVQ
jgi:prepilin-type processing-associated H-X9-DG protein